MNTFQFLGPHSNALSWEGNSQYQQLSSPRWHNAGCDAFAHLSVPRSYSSVFPSSSAATLVGTNSRFVPLSSRPSFEQMDDALLRTLRSVFEEAFVDLQPDADGTLHVHVPFCGSFMEASVLQKFLREDVMKRNPAIKKFDVVATDINPSVGGAIHSLPKHPQVVHALRKGSVEGKGLRSQFSVRTGVLDLSTSEMPRCQIAIGLHPQVVGYEKDGWDHIIATVVQNSDVAVFTTWMGFECKTLEEKCSALGASVRTQRNPHAVKEGPEEGEHPDYESKRFHWVLIAKRNRSSGPLASSFPTVSKAQVAYPGVTATVPISRSSPTVGVHVDALSAAAAAAANPFPGMAMWSDASLPAFYSGGQGSYMPPPPMVPYYYHGGGGGGSQGRSVHKQYWL
eukprot:NODE_1625_length_1466_cov_34.382498_g1467_i0.p1 GENE.NODE_1625_length_1466_cov_34.382498_g1467_i0~~NODE_1625_length_1466_cov_34.382498_g1467_i0.p1  ORF type:complete len:423 (+),score=66.65 NODE_1625_length_1466_cov_34.382498_g1467_i0:82-1269(+)